jgi:type I restriction enzyme M protein
VRGEEKLKQFELGHKWKFNKKNCEWEKGKLGIVLPDGIYGNDQLGYIRQYIKENMIILAIIDIPKETFQPNTSTKTTILIAEKKDSETQVEKNHNVFMAICETCGHNRRGDIIPDDDISLVSNEYKKFLTNPGKL